MPFQEVGDTAEVIIAGTRNGQEIVNTFYAHKPGGYVQADIDALATAVDLWVAGQWLNAVDVAYSYVETRVRGLTAPIDLEGSSNVSAGPGTVAGVPYPNNATLSVKRRSAFTGRGARGRVFLPGLTNANSTDEDHMTAAFAAGVEEVLNNMRATMATVNWVEVIVHRVAGGVPLPAAVVYTVVEYAVVDLVIDSMRRRLPKRGS